LRATIALEFFKNQFLFFSASVDHLPGRAVLGRFGCSLFDIGKSFAILISTMLFFPMKPDLRPANLTGPKAEAQCLSRAAEGRLAAGKIEDP
jgi:hypothetical protein